MELHEKEALVKNMDKLEPDKFGTALGIIRNSKHDPHGWPALQIWTGAQRDGPNHLGLWVKSGNKILDLDDADSDEEITIDIDTLDNKTLWDLHKYIMQVRPPRPAAATSASGDRPYTTTETLPRRAPVPSPQKTLGGGGGGGGGRGTERLGNHAAC